MSNDKRVLRRLHSIGHIVEISWHREFIGKVSINIGLLQLISVSCISFEFAPNILFTALYIASSFIFARTSADPEFFSKEALIDI